MLKNWPQTAVQRKVTGVTHLVIPCVHRQLANLCQRSQFMSTLSRRLWLKPKPY